MVLQSIVPQEHLLVSCSATGSPSILQSSAPPAEERGGKERIAAGSLMAHLPAASY